MCSVHRARGNMVCAGQDGMGGGGGGGLGAADLKVLG